MNSRGIYTALVAIIVIAAIGGTFLYLRKPALENGAEITARSVREVKMAWENARIVMDKATGDAATQVIAENFTKRCADGERNRQQLRKICEEENVGRLEIKGKIDEYWGKIFTAINGATGMNGGRFESNIRHADVEVLEAGSSFWLGKDAGGNTITYNENDGRGNEVLFNKRLERLGECMPDGKFRCKITAHDAQTGNPGIVDAKAEVFCDSDCGTGTPPPSECKVMVTPESTTSGKVTFRATYSGGSGVAWGWDSGICIPNGDILNCTCSSSTTGTTINATATIQCDDLAMVPAQGSASYNCPKDCVVSIEDGGTDGSKKVINVFVDGTPPGNMNKPYGKYKEGGNCTGSLRGCSQSSGTAKCDCKDAFKEDICGFRFELDQSRFPNCILTKTYYEFNINPC